MSTLFIGAGILCLVIAVIRKLVKDKKTKKAVAQIAPDAAAAARIRENEGGRRRIS